jgi:hypothetical protein
LSIFVKGIAMKTTLLKRIGTGLALVSSLLLAACGGGGGSSAPAASGSSFFGTAAVGLPLVGNVTVKATEAIASMSRA